MGCFITLLTATKTVVSTSLNFCFSPFLLSPDFRALGCAFQLVQFCPPQLGLFHRGHMRFRLDASSPSYPDIYLKRKPQLFTINFSSILEIFGFHHYPSLCQPIWTLCSLHTELRNYGLFAAHRFCQETEGTHNAIAFNTL